MRIKNNLTFFSAFILEMRDEVENMPGDLQPSKILHDEQRLDRLDLICAQRCLKLAF